MRHWAYDYIGKPWRSGALGPAVFSCWGLITAVLHERLQVQMPYIETGTDDNVRALKAAVSTGWEQVQFPPREYDLLVMRGREGRHIAVIIEADGQLVVLHANGCDTPQGPKGEVVAQTLAQVTADGFGEYELWRKV